MFAPSRRLSAEALCVMGWRAHSGRRPSFALSGSVFCHCRCLSMPATEVLRHSLSRRSGRRWFAAPAGQLSRWRVHVNTALDHTPSDGPRVGLSAWKSLLGPTRSWFRSGPTMAAGMLAASIYKSTTLVLAWHLNTGGSWRGECCLRAHSRRRRIRI